MTSLNPPIDGVQNTTRHAISLAARLHRQPGAGAVDEASWRWGFIAVLILAAISAAVVALVAAALALLTVGGRSDGTLMNEESLDPAPA